DRIEDPIMAAAGRLEKAIAPERDLWPGVEKAIRARSRTQRWPAFAQAAAVVLLVGASSAVTYFVVHEEPRVIEVPRPAVSAEFASFAGAEELGAEYASARGHLVSQFDRELARLTPAARADVERNLAVIRQAIDEISAALDQEPDNQLLQQLLVATYREEAAMMKKVGSLTQQLLPREDI
ncbi:MAG: hypothetical protein R3176_07185, partial [Woeseiaceae bacterium]|nr:hypothetical protein [Woeseiaceae bacterium]